MISVIIPNYNHAPYLKKRIDSVLDQTFQDFEIIILDDYSTDNSKEIIETYRSNEKISHIIFNDVNSGSTFKQWKKGVELAKGEYIWIAESDDWAESTFLEKLMRVCINEHSFLAFTQSYIISENNDIIREYASILEYQSQDSSSFLTQNLLYGNRLYNASMILFKKDLVRSDIWNKVEKLRYCGDWLFWAELMKSIDGNVSEVKEPLNYFRCHSLNVSSGAEAKGLTFLEGFPISKKIFKQTKYKNKKEFCKKWFETWFTYRQRYNFSKKTNLNILFMFCIYQPKIAILEIKRILLDKNE